MVTTADRRPALAVMRRVGEEVVHRAGPEAARVDLDRLEARGEHCVVGVGEIGDSRRVLGVDLDPGRVTEVAYAQVADVQAGFGEGSRAGRARRVRPGPAAPG